MIREAAWRLGAWLARRTERRERPRTVGRARLRVAWVVAHDRAAVPCGRWVSLGPRPPRWLASPMQVQSALAQGRSDAVARAYRPHYRWEVRR